MLRSDDLQVLIEYDKCAAVFFVFFLWTDLALVMIIDDWGQSLARNMFSQLQIKLLFIYLINTMKQRGMNI